MLTGKTFPPYVLMFKGHEKILQVDLALYANDDANVEVIQGNSEGCSMLITYNL